ncbi:MAG: YifB family Mg chelatase-like AAA ATPase [Roseburia sp.]|nr:YifB family Mg chelatase-like AAA ATPase [Roseburia sp.]
MYSIVSTAIIQGIQSIPVSVEADVSDGMPMFEMVGFLASEVKEARERVRTALRNSGFVLPPKHITINFTPANIRKSGSGFDLPIAAAILAALEKVPKASLEETFLIGEVGLNGKVQPVHGVLPMVAEAKERGIRRCIVPMENKSEAELVAEMKVFGVGSIEMLVHLLRGEKTEEEETIFPIEEKESAADEPDFADIQGQKMVKRACEVAVCGMHNLLMIGPPGSGKTMMAMRIPSILPPLDEKEQMELSKVYSVSGLFLERKGLMCERPFRSPHHTITAQGLAGGGVVPKPGEISLAHKGVLFLDELPEFQKNTLEILRQPMEEKKVRLVRLQGSYEYPAEFMLVAAMNPCRCGNYPDMHKCHCTQTSIERYLGKISKPLIDRIDVCVEAPRIEFKELRGDKKEETSATIRERVVQVQKIQQERYAGESFCFNSQIPAVKIREYCRLDDKQEAYMEQIYKRLTLTARSYHKILKVARTLADMDGEEKIQNRHLNEAICYRSLDKKFWERV